MFEFSLPAALEFTVLVPGPIPCSEFRNTSIRILETATRSKYDSHLAQRLLDMYESIQRPDWKWFENVVAYGNARLPQAMLLVGSACADDRMVSAGLDSLDWLMETQRCQTNGHFVPIGSQGFYHQGGEKARFDQQPIEAAGAVSACLEAYRVTGDSRWRNAGLVGLQLVSWRQRSAAFSLRF